MNLFNKIKTSLIKSEENNFKYLYGLLKNESEIDLKTDIVLDDSEIDEFKEGIKIDRNNVVINGNGHVIDGKNIARIFDITGKNVALKNIRFKNGYSEFGGWVQNRGVTDIIDCEFANDVSSDSTTIYNYSKASITNCRFNLKTANGSSYRILLNSKMARCYIKKCSLKNELIFNMGFLIIDENERKLENNVSNDEGQIFIMSKKPQRENISDYIYNLTHGEKEITLNGDLILDGKSILLDTDNLIIDGNHHVITSMHELGLFKILGNNITLKNMIFKDSHAEYVNGGAIESKGKNLRIENCIFENNSSLWSGGAIESDGSLQIEDSIFIRNSAKNGAVITSGGDLKIVNCEFASNESTCTSSRKSVKIENSIFKDNFRKDLSLSGIASICDCEFIKDIENNHESINLKTCNLEMKNTYFTNNRQSAGITAKDSKIDIEDSRFKDCLKAINTEKCDLMLKKSKFTNNLECISSDSYLTIYKCEFSQKEKDEFAVRIEGNADSSFSIQNTIFNCESEKILHIMEGYCILRYNEYALKDNYAIFNENGEIEIINEKFNNPASKCIYSNYIIKSDDDIENLIEKGENCQIKPIKQMPPLKYKGFTYLENLINENDEITLEHDILMHESEQDYFEGGIEISRDNLRINGNGHTIDGSELSRIFYITANNVILENITFKNGKYIRSKFDSYACGGGAIYLLHDTSLKLINCIFTDNSSRQSSGAIRNNGERLTVIGSEFENNIAHNGNSGAIYNECGELTIENCQFKSNNSNTYAGAIYNENGTLNISSSIFKNNNVELSYFGGSESGNAYAEEKDLFKENRGGAIYNKNGDLNVLTTNFEENECSKGGGIYNTGNSFRIIDCYFSKNKSEEGASIYNSNKNKFVFTSCIFEDNDSQGAGIYNKESILDLEKCNFNNNVSSQNGTALYNNNGVLNLKKCIFNSNRAVWGKCGGAISSFYGTINIENCNFKRNEARNGGVIDNYNGKVYINSSNFDENNSEWKGGSLLNRERGYFNVSNCNFNNNNAKTATDIYNLAGEIELFRCVFKNNEKSIIINKDCITLKECELADYHEIFDFENATTNIMP